MDKTNMSEEKISVGRQGRSPVPMNLPREDDGRIHPAVGERANTSAAHYADAAEMVGDPTGPAFKQASGR